MGAGVLAVQWEKDSMYGLTLVWALTAVYGEQSAPLVAFSALTCIGVLLVVVLLRCVSRDAGVRPGMQGCVQGRRGVSRDAGVCLGMHVCAPAVI